MKELSNPLIAETKELLNVGRKVALKVAENLYKIREELYPEKHKEFVDLCEEEFGLKASQVSKYETIGDAFFAHGYTAENFLMDGSYRDYEVVYHAAKLPLDPEKKLAHALTLTRGDIKKTHQSLSPHAPDYKMVCVVSGCWVSQENHAS